MWSGINVPFTRGEEAYKDDLWLISAQGHEGSIILIEKFFGILGDVEVVSRDFTSSHAWLLCELVRGEHVNGMLGSGWVDCQFAHTFLVVSAP